MAAFLDLKGAYDNVDRNLLMLNLLSSGLPHYFVLLLCEMYKYVKLVVRVAGKCSTPVQSLLGLKHGCVLSPKLFSLVYEFFAKNNAPMISIDLLKLCLLLFADDIVLLAETKEKLQQLLEITEVYLEGKKLILNTSKSVVIVFGRKAMESEDVSFFFKGETMPVNNEFVYLGVKFTSNGKFSGHLDLANARGRYISGEIARSSLRRVIDIRVHKRIWISKIVRAMHYGAEIWGYRKGPKLEVVMMRYHKRMLGLWDSFSNLVIRGDLGLVSLRSMRLVTMVRYWVRILGM